MLLTSFRTGGLIPSETSVHLSYRNISDYEVRQFRIAFVRLDLGPDVEVELIPYFGYALLDGDGQSAQQGRRRWRASAVISGDTVTPS